MPAKKKKRAHKVSSGEHGGGGKVQLTELQKALMGKGRFWNTIKPVDHKR